MAFSGYERPDWRIREVLAGFAVLPVLLVAWLLSDAAQKGMAFPISGLATVLFLLVFPPVGLPLLAAIVLLFYFGWLRPISRSRVQFTALTWIGLLTLAALSCIWYWSCWGDGLKWQGDVYTRGCAQVGAACIGVVVTAALSARVTGWSWPAVLSRWLVMLWVATYGFPWLGELP